LFVLVEWINDLTKTPIASTTFCNGIINIGRNLMADAVKVPLQAPGGSWESMKRTIRAYHAAADEETPTVERVAQIAGMQRPVVSGSNNFLRSAGILQEGANKLTAVGTRFATGLGLNNQSLSTSALREIVKGQEGLSYLVNILQARSSMTLEAFRGEIVLVTGLDENSRNLQFLKTIVDLLQESGLVRAADDEITFRGTYIGELNGRAETPPRPQTTKMQEPVRSTVQNGTIVPISLGVGRLVQVELPNDWTSRDLPKLLKMLELSLSDSEGSAGERQ
jgi:hypothetical protein